ncbi:hypothetical protein [Streptomyces subrutilus]|uniref:Uncharacterized protein n=1 Tax=Streptomyces subrutilus TaxID=36818 RepID=A0A1E5PKE4_9ACTN|nr:hypothetical protein [Streptomyces subrutilus]OEJ30000.1 hypothetical protein BGK67_00075 [Streptomyces subrutilus]
MSTTAQPRVVRVYTNARRHPWVLGKLADWVIWFGPYTPAQLVVLGGGAFTLIKTYDWWSWAGPVPIALWVGAVWAVRGAQIAGQNPFTAAAGMFVLLLRHPAGRIGGRVARDRRPSHLVGQFVIQQGPVCAAVVEAQAGRPVLTPAGGRGAVAGSGLSRLLGQASAAEEVA